MSLRKFFESKWFIIGGVIILMLLVLAYARAWYQEYQIRQDIAALQNETARLESKKLQILDQLAYVQSSAYIEAKARTELNLAKQGEHMVVLGENKAQGSLASGSEGVVQSKPQSNAQRWLRYFIH